MTFTGARGAWVCVCGALHAQCESMCGKPQRVSHYLHPNLFLSQERAVVLQRMSLCLIRHANQRCKWPGANTPER